ncbi:hypothetical protein SAMN04515665_10327 [Blastococcus sp. DSM 46786]|uniref:hypothetical protein n=1 Tax=Blastococcus sp. DSM 46786 TaxID=1798227 RepID=UPI0008CFE522|nr:hypothetical protein [Blastococcus sp. DSM 46786]SEK55628.1 hypothetical protein SAMN04515665_10327 [Blastococcus sp. DSM 46786]
MTTRDPGRARPLPPEETATAGGGTPAPVDVSVDTRAVTAVVVFLAGPVISSVHFMLVYLVTEAGCTGDGPGLDAFDPPVPTVVTLVTTAVAALACVATAWWGYARWRALRRAHPEAGADELVDRRPLAFGGFLLSLLGLATVLFVGLPALFLGACA